MEEVSVLIKHRGVWVGENIYESSCIDGVVVRPDISFKLFHDEIASQVGIDDTRKSLRLRYVLDGNAVPMDIRNDMGVRMYLSFVKNTADMIKYPLCVDPCDSEVGSNSLGVAAFALDDGATAMECHESDYVCRPLMVMESDERLHVADVGQMGGLNIISNPNTKVVRVKQRYIDKKTLVSVMHNYALDHRFQFYAKRSCKSRYFFCMPRVAIST